MTVASPVSTSMSALRTLTIVTTSSPLAQIWTVTTSAPVSMVTLVTVLTALIRTNAPTIHAHLMLSAQTLRDHSPALVMPASPVTDSLALIITSALTVKITVTHKPLVATTMVPSPVLVTPDILVTASTVSMTMNVPSQPTTIAHQTLPAPTCLAHTHVNVTLVSVATELLVLIITSAFLV